MMVPLFSSLREKIVNERFESELVFEDAFGTPTRDQKPSSNGRQIAFRHMIVSRLELVFELFPGGSRGSIRRSGLSAELVVRDIMATGQSSAGAKRRIKVTVGFVNHERHRGFPRLRGQRLDHGVHVDANGTKPTRPAEFKNHPRSGSVVLPSFSSVKLLFHLIHFPAHVGHLEFEHFCELSRRAKHVLMLLIGLGEDGFGEEKLRIHRYRANAAIHNELDRPAAGMSLNAFLAYLPSALLVHVVLLEALFVNYTVGRDVGQDHTLHPLQTLGFGEIER
jgi:hypothetical protein